MLLHPSVQRGLFGAATLAGNRVGNRRPLGLPAAGHQPRAGQRAIRPHVPGAARRRAGEARDDQRREPRGRRAGAGAAAPAGRTARSISCRAARSRSPPSWGCWRSFSATRTGDSGTSCSPMTARARHPTPLDAVVGVGRDVQNVDGKSMVPARCVCHGSPLTGETQAPGCVDPGGTPRLWPIPAAPGARPPGPAGSGKARTA